MKSATSRVSAKNIRFPDVTSWTQPRHCATPSGSCVRHVRTRNVTSCLSEFTPFSVIEGRAAGVPERDSGFSPPYRYGGQRRHDGAGGGAKRERVASRALSSIGGARHRQPFRAFAQIARRIAMLGQP